MFHFETIGRGAGGLPMGDTVANSDPIHWTELAGFDMGVADLAPAQVVTGGGRRGYSLGRSSLEGVALITAHHGYELVLRLKDTRPLLIDEIDWWGGQMADLVDSSDYDYVGSAPSSGKVPETEHLARLLSVSVASRLGLSRVDMFVNPAPRGHRAGKEEKLAERSTKPFRYIGPSHGRLLVIDDVIYTASTAMRCHWAAEHPDRGVSFLILYRA